MKKWMIGLLMLAIGIYLATPQVMYWMGIRTTRVMVFNGNESTARYTFNGNDLALAAGEAQVFQTSRFNNKIKFDQGDDRLRITFGPGQHFVNLGERELRIYEQYYHWNEQTQKFNDYPTQPINRLLYDAAHGRGLTTLDNCWDCCLLLPPHERAYRFLKPANKDKRMILSSLF